MIYTVTLNPAIDLVVRLDGPLQADAVNRAAGEEYVLGGKGINVSGVLAELGCPSVALGLSLIHISNTAMLGLSSPKVL